jgi:hypothetical protein
MDDLDAVLNDSSTYANNSVQRVVVTATEPA